MISRCAIIAPPRDPRETARAREAGDCGASNRQPAPRRRAEPPHPAQILQGGFREQENAMFTLDRIWRNSPRQMRGDGLSEYNVLIADEGEYRVDFRGSLD